MKRANYRWQALLLVLATVSVASSEAFASPPVQDKERAFKAFTLKTPNWIAAQELDQGATGKLVLNDPAGSGRFVRISWFPGQRNDPSGFEPVLEKYGMHPIADQQITIDGRKYAVHRFENASLTKRLAEASYNCAESDTFINIWTFISSDWNESVGVVQRILSSIQCSKIIPSVVRPLFTPKYGYKKVEENREIVIYANTMGDALAFATSTVSDKKLSAQEMKYRFTTLFSSSGMKDITFDNHARQMENKEIFSGDGKSANGTKLFVLSTVWNCPKIGLSFFGAYVGSRDPISSKGEKLLATAKCP